MVPHLIFGDQHSPIGHTLRINRMMCTVIIIVRDDAHGRAADHSHKEDDGLHPNIICRLLICYDPTLMVRFRHCCLGQQSQAK